MVFRNGKCQPRFLTPGKLQTSAGEYNDVCRIHYIGVGRFALTPGLIIGVESEALQTFIHDLGKAIQIVPGTMLHPCIANAFAAKKEEALMQPDVHPVAESA
ncbi:MAG: hypothetical protein IPH18_18110 [Chitinophagaceae bacterium]|nr:hypothetical protein [Chitinophagaceae bacterium]